MLYFKTKKGRLIIQLSLSENQSIYMLISPTGDKSLYGYKTSFIEEKSWMKLLEKSKPSVLEENTEDYKKYEEAVKEQNEREQEVTEQDWLMSKGMEFYGTPKKP